MSGLEKNYGGSASWPIIFHFACSFRYIANPFKISYDGKFNVVPSATYVGTPGPQLHTFLMDVLSLLSKVVTQGITIVFYQLSCPPLKILYPRWLYLQTSLIKEPQSNHLVHYLPLFDSNLRLYIFVIISTN